MLVGRDIALMCVRPEPNSAGNLNISCIGPSEPPLSASKCRLLRTFRNFHWPKVEVTDGSWAQPLKREKRAKLSLRLITDYRLKVLESLDLDPGDPKRRANGEMPRLAASI